ncbi:metallophosphoesterase [uncultured Alistipes sp.]|uniref:metallophosphoesterase n=1 Tax=uncultured Alistipes sp. TaxID=538949 RepID=UPI0025F39DB9|nr:metallophosphoesterase [uncultured Alistipes sp.]
MFSFGVVTDVHYSQAKETFAGRYYRASAEKLAGAVETFNRAGVDFVVSLGDLIDNDIESCKVIGNLLEISASPVFKILGNHDFMIPYDSRQQQCIFDELGIGERYYSFVRDDYRLILLDGNDVSVYAHAEDSHAHAEAIEVLAALKAGGAANAQIYNGAIGSDQQQWLLRELEQATTAGQQVICLCHFPLTPLDGKYTLWNNRQIAAILAQHVCVKAFLAGHHHTGGYFAYEKIHFFTFPGMVESTENRYAIVDVYPGKIVIRGYGTQQGTTLLHLR